jgi:hypothetical protein
MMWLESELLRTVVVVVVVVVVAGHVVRQSRHNEFLKKENFVFSITNN